MKLTTPSRNKEETRAFLEGKPSDYSVPGFIVPHGYRLLSGTDKVTEEGIVKNICLVTDSANDSETVYKVKLIVRSEPNSYLPCKNCTQLIVWRAVGGRHSAVTSGFPAKIFNHLLDNYDIMITDEQQTSDGKRFWMDRIGEAIELPAQHVYYVDLNNLDDEMSPIVEGISDFEDFITEFEPKGWGNDEEHRNRAFMISKSDLSTLISK
ncbi:hypothetical protein AB4456_10545 [Vibrio splendidus]